MWTELETEQELGTGTTGRGNYLIFHRDLMKKQQRLRFGSLCWELINGKSRNIFFSFQKIKSWKLAVVFQGCLCGFFCRPVLEVQDQLRKCTQSMWGLLLATFIFLPFYFYLPLLFSSWKLRGWRIVTERFFVLQTIVPSVSQEEQKKFTF